MMHPVNMQAGEVPPVSSQGVAVNVLVAYVGGVDVWRLLQEAHGLQGGVVRGSEHPVFSDVRRRSAGEETVSGEAQGGGADCNSCSDRSTCLEEGFPSAAGAVLNCWYESRFLI